MNCARWNSKNDRRTEQDTGKHNFWPEFHTIDIAKRYEAKYTNDYLVAGLTDIKSATLAVVATAYPVTCFYVAFLACLDCLVKPIRR